MNTQILFRASALSAAIAGLVQPGAVMAQQGALEEVIVTATRRAESVQDIPINITALSADMIERERLTNLAEVSRRVPGMTVVDQGARGSDILTVRGLNVDSLNASEALGNGGGDTVATYVGEIPLYIDLKLNDMERVEVLIGPQGTLYGAGTLGGAVRFIPRKPDPDALALELRGELYDLSQSSDLGSETGLTINIPLLENRLALRASVDYTDDPGFIDYNFLVRNPGISLPQPNFSDPNAVRDNLRRQADANTEETLSGRVALRYAGERVDSTLTYYYQNMDVGARQINHREAIGTGKYEAAHRYLEPNERENQLLALELVADLGFAELTSATGVSRYEEQGQRDQTDLLLNFEYGYEEFPAFAAFTREDAEEDRINQELRLVSTSDGPLSWIAGVFYNKSELDAQSLEFTPGFDQFAVDNFGGEQLRPDALEYIEITANTLTEKAVFGEIGYQITDVWQVTLGARYFEYESDLATGFDLPLLNTVFFGAPPDLIDPILQSNSVEDDGSLFKFNTSYHFTDDIMAFFTISEGYRIGGLNSVPECPNPLPPGVQNVCALPDEVLIEPDKTVNYELGLHSQFGDTVLFNASLFYIDWDDIQVADVTANGGLPITSNGNAARSMGVEMAGQWLLTERITLMGSYAYTDAELAEDAPGLVDGADAFDGDRLAGTPEHQGSLALNYAIPMADGSEVELDWSLTASGDILTKVGNRNNGETLPGYALHNVSASWYKDDWTVTLYADNVLDKYAETSVRQDSSFIRQVGDVDLRRYFKNVIRPRQTGLRLVYRF
ncbi:MAG: TonB-dependent receptor [Haliea sp.]|uniref:TonB-dependent receptor n=1 Tax=Haliea sp. TaxID=1932666 RepID=UPI0032EAC6CF